MSEAQFQMIEIERLKESPLNPRRHYDEAKLAELVDSVKEQGEVVTPLLVRPSNGDFEIGAGHRRYRAAKLADIRYVPAVVREMDDKQFLELLNFENLQREDIHPLEEAEGYHTLIKKLSYSIEGIAHKIGKSVKYVYDRLKLIQLIAPAKKLFMVDRMTAGHAILLARLKPEDQERAINFDNRDVWSYEKALFAPDNEPEEYPFKICSVRELEAWIDQHVRFHKDVTAVDPMLFPETKTELLKAFQEKEKVVQITWNHFTPPDAKEGNKERIFHVSSWKRADGSSKEAKSCEKSVTGVIVVGPERGRAFKVCMNKECMVHWAKEKKQHSPRNDWARQEERRRAEQAAQEKKEQAWKAAVPEILNACASRLKELKPEAVFMVFERHLGHRTRKLAAELLKPGKSAEDLYRFAALTLLIEECYEWDAYEDFPKIAKHLGVDVAPILKKHAPKEEKLKIGQKLIEEAYSADIIEKAKVRKPIEVAGKLYIVTARTTDGKATKSFEAVELIPAGAFKDKTITYQALVLSEKKSEAARNSKRGFYYGIKVQHGSKEYVLGAKVDSEALLKMLQTSATAEAQE